MVPENGKATGGALHPRVVGVQRATVAQPQIKLCCHSPSLDSDPRTGTMQVMGTPTCLDGVVDAGDL
jgi:hypothetical protein